MNKKLSNQYIAGFFDGEGCVDVFHGHSQERRRRPRIRISQRQSHVLKEIVRSLGFGRVTKSRSTFQWGVKSKRDIIKFVKSILPYSIVKKPQLEIALEFCKWIQSNPTGIPLPKESVNKREELYKKLKELNQT